MKKILDALKSLPTILVLGASAAGALTLYIHTREQAAIERALMQQHLDSLAAAREADSIAFAVQDSIRQDSIAKLQDQIAADTAKAAASSAQAIIAGEDFDFNYRQLRSVLPNGQRAVLDAMKTAHGQQVSSLTDANVRLQRAVFLSAQVHAQDSLRIQARDDRIVFLNGQIAELIKTVNKANHKSTLTRIVESPWTHLATAGLGYWAGTKQH